MENFEEKFLKAIAEKICEPSFDAYNNKVDSPIIRFMRDWADSQTTTIVPLVVQKLNINDLAKEIAIGFIETAEGVYGSSWDRDVFSKELRIKVIEKLAEKIAIEKMEEMKKMENKNL